MPKKKTKSFVDRVKPVGPLQVAVSKSKSKSRSKSKSSEPPRPKVVALSRMKLLVVPPNPEEEDKCYMMIQLGAEEVAALGRIVGGKNLRPRELSVLKPLAQALFREWIMRG